MPNLSNIIYITEADYSTLLNGGTITKGGVTYSYDNTALYVIKDVNPPAYAVTAGYANRAGTASEAIGDEDGNRITSFYARRLFLINLIYDVDEDSWSCDASNHDIYQAWNTGRLVVATEGTSIFQLIGVPTSTVAKFKGFSAEETNTIIAVRIRTVNDNQSVTIDEDYYQSYLSSGDNIKTINNQSLLGSGNLTPSDIGAGIFLVTITSTGSGSNITYSADKTFSQIADAITSGRNVIAQFGEDQHVLMYYEPGANIYFTEFYATEIETYASTFDISSNNSIHKYEFTPVNNLTTDSPGLFLDAYQGKVLKDLINTKQSQHRELGEFIQTYLENLPTSHEDARALTQDEAAALATITSNDIWTLLYYPCGFDWDSLQNSGYYSWSANIGSIVWEYEIMNDSGLYWILFSTRTLQSELVSGTNIKTINNQSLLGSGNLTASDIGALPSNTHIPNDIKAGSVAGKLYRNDVNGSGNFTVKGNSGCIPNLIAGTFLVSIYAKSATQSYTFRFNFGSITYDLSTTNGEISDVRQITISSSGTFSGLVLNGSVASGTILYVVMYNYLTPISTVGPAAVTNRYSDLDGTPTIPTVPSAYTSNPSMNGTASAGSSSNWSRGDHIHPHDTSKADVLTLVTVSTSGAVTQTLDANKFYKFTASLTSLTLTLNAAASGLAIYAGRFIAGADDMPISLPSGTIIPDNAVAIESGNTYEFNIMDNVCLIVDVTAS